MLCRERAVRSRRLLRLSAAFDRWHLAVDARLRHLHDQRVAADRHFRRSFGAAAALRQALVAWALLAQAKAPTSSAGRVHLAAAFQVIPFCTHL